MHTKAKENNKLGKLFSSFLDTVNGFYDPALFALLKRIASSSPSPTDVEVAWSLLGGWGNTGLSIPQAIPPASPLSFPVDHGEHWDFTIEWHFLTLSLNLEGGGRVSAVIIIFRKAIASPASAPEGTTGFHRQIFSTSLGVTLEMPGKPTIHHAYPVVTLAPIVGGVEYGNDPFHLTVGEHSIKGSVDMFPLRLRTGGPSDPLAGRPEIKIDVECSAENPLFLQGKDGYVGSPGSPGPAYYYYSWANQPTAGVVTIDGHSHVAPSGLAWMDHQWGGAPVPASPVKPGWSGWSWFEFEFDGNRGLTLACPHADIVDGKLPAVVPGFGVFVDGKTSTFVDKAVLVVNKYTKSPNTDANYPSAWQLAIDSEDCKIKLAVSATTLCDQQSLWQGGLTEYAEAAVTVKAEGVIDGKHVVMAGVGYCESVGFEDPSEADTRRRAWLESSLHRH